MIQASTKSYSNSNSNFILLIINIFIINIIIILIIYKNLYRLMSLLTEYFVIKTQLKKLLKFESILIINESN